MKAGKVVFLILILVTFWIPNAWPEWNTLAVGKLLVADRTLQDPRFVQSVILLFRYGKEGAAGLILNHPTPTGVSKLFPEIVGVQKRKDLVHLGGPVSIESVFVLLQSHAVTEKSERVFENIFITSDKTTIHKLLGSNGNEKQLRLYAGYAGWGVGQLELEVAGGYWHVLPAETKAIFHTNPTEVWREFLDRSNIIQANLTDPQSEIFTRSQASK
jgi:putative transcriptional regulator